MALLEEFPARTTILVVDANNETLLDMCRIMSRYNYQVIPESNAETALEYLTKCKHDINLVIWDFHMPKINGVEALKAIGSTMDLPVVIMSDDIQRDSVIKATIHGACDYVLKPVKEEELAIIWQHIVRKRMMSYKPAFVPKPLQSDLVQSGRLDHTSGKRTRATWTGDIPPYQTYGLDQTSALRTPTTWTGVGDIQTACLNQGNGELNMGTNTMEENAGKKPRTEGHADLDNDFLKLLFKGNSQENAADGDFNILFGDNDKANIGNEKELSLYHQLKFVEAIERVGGVEKANPTELLKCMEDDMKIEGLTRDTLSKHLQRYRLRLKDTQTAHQQTQGTGWSPSLQGSNNNASSSHLPNGQAMNPIEQNQYQTAHQQTQRTGWSPSLQGLNNNASSSYLPNGQAMNPIQQNQYQTADQQTQRTGWSPSLQGSNNNASSSYLPNGQAMNPIQQNQHQNGYLTMGNNHFITKPPHHFPYFDNLHMNKPSRSSYDNFFEQLRQIYPDPSEGKQQVQSSKGKQKVQSSKGKQQVQAAPRQQQYPSAPQQQQCPSAHQQHQYHPDNHQHQYQSANQQHQYRSAPQQQASDIHATDVELIHPSLSNGP